MLFATLGAIARLGSARSIDQRDVLPIPSTSEARHRRLAGLFSIEHTGDKGLSSLRIR